jgi:uncharacterized protein YjbI with pentapeptide repeats
MSRHSVYLLYDGRVLASCRLSDKRNENSMNAYTPLDYEQNMYAELAEQTLAERTMELGREVNNSAPRADLTDLDLAGANLRGRIMRNVDLCNSNLRNALMNDVDLRGANLMYATARGADLRGADLRGADLTETDLRGADLRGADFTGAILTNADFYGAELSDLNFTGAIF